MSASQHALSTLRDVGPCSASAAIVREMSSIATSNPRDSRLSQRYCGSAAVMRNQSCSMRVTVPSSTTLPSSSVQQRYVTRPGFIFETSRHVMRERYAAASFPRTSYL